MEWFPADALFSAVTAVATVSALVLKRDLLTVCANVFMGLDSVIDFIDSPHRHAVYLHVCHEYPSAILNALDRYPCHRLIFGDVAVTFSDS